MKYGLVYCLFYKTKGYAKDRVDGCLSSEKLAKMLEEGFSANCSTAQI